MSKVKLQDNLGRVVNINADATKGAIVGVNLYGPDGETLIDPASLGLGGGGSSSTPWDSLSGIPRNINALAQLSGIGYPVLVGPADWRMRTFRAGGGITVVNGNGRDGDTVVRLEEVGNTEDGQALLKITRDVYGRVIATAAATTDDLAEGGSNLYFTAARADARADARIAAQKGQPNGITPLDAASKIPTQYLPALAITATYVVNSEAAQLALVVEEGDVAVRTDQNRTYIQNGGTSGTMADWTQLLMPAAPVQSVNGKTGTVVLTLADLGAAPAAAPAMTLAAANALTGVQDFQVVGITDLSGGRELCWYDATVATGTKWRRFSDRSIAN
ncbi:TPA: hypothetical protein ACOEPF_000436 [Stenotrophomonas maltophilia]|uniref:hypothetical protein n=1 Tax=Stenotrophomonas TaxID=40323 RepID=UPI00201CFB03|nr:MULTISPECIES: hypothetical protein [Stenotrophomonas]MBN5024483.1 hypothetical protein [Stenotrophomonas maltophilia]MDH1274523.1 hypothetical protein [Stenotrophomonas sp. GD03937]MDH1484980.1 hypothetical protein [Stenotrophomonas sp. GD03712]UQY95845.1 hypothetical protein LZ605_00305 [Stenotrophomonas maltophilia]UQY98091.1 hypothetical protein LZ605_22605 [Stenotrophomonas maltophilia]